MSSPSRRSQPQGSLHIRSTNGWGILAPMAFAKQLFIFAAAFCMVPTKKVVVIRVQRASKIAGTKKPIEGHCRHLVLLLYERYRTDSEHMNPVRKKAFHNKFGSSCCQKNWKSLSAYISELYSYQRLLKASLLKYIFQVLEHISW